MLCVIVISDRAFKITLTKLMRISQLLRRYEAGDRDFQGCDLSGLDLGRGIFIGCNFAHANLTGVNLSRAFLTHSDFSGARFNWANLK